MCQGEQDGRVCLLWLRSTPGWIYNILILKMVVVVGGGARNALGNANCQ